MRAKIVKKLDGELLTEAIVKYIEETNNEDIFLIMSHKTVADLALTYNVYVKKNDFALQFVGYNIAICDAIPYGEVEIR